MCHEHLFVRRFTGLKVKNYSRGRAQEPLLSGRFPSKTFSTFVRFVGSSKERQRAARLAGFLFPILNTFGVSSSPTGIKRFRSLTRMINYQRMICTFGLPERVVTRFLHQ